MKYLPVIDLTISGSNDLVFEFFLPFAQDWESVSTPNTTTSILRSAAFHPITLLARIMLMADNFSVEIPGMDELLVVVCAITVLPSAWVIRSSSRASWCPILLSLLST